MAVVADQDIVQGFNVITTVSSPDSNTPIMTGKYTSVSLTVTHDFETYLETEEQIARILDGEFTFEGTLRRGWQHPDIFRRVFGLDTMTRGLRIIVPRFTVTCTLDAPNKPALNGRRISILGCVSNTLALEIAAGKSVSTKDLRFRGEGFTDV